MTEQRYRFGGPIPESVQRLKKLREYRASRLYARIKRYRADSTPAPSAEKAAAMKVLAPFVHGAVVTHHPIGAREPVVIVSHPVSAHDAGSVVKDLALADGTNHTVVDSHDCAAAKNDGFPTDEAGLADVVSSLIDAWSSGPGLAMGGITAQRKFSAGEFDQRVLAALIEGCLQFQIFLLQLGQIRLELQKSGVVSEQSLLRLEQLLQKRRSPLVDECAVSCRTDSFGDVARSGE